MTRQQRIKVSDADRARYWRDPEPNRIRARCRKTRMLIDRARIEALRLLQGMVPA